MKDIIAARLREHFRDSVENVTEFREELTVVVRKSDIVEVCRFLRDTDGLKFDSLRDICGTDRAVTEDRYEVVYNLFSLVNKYRFRIKVKIDESDMHIPSVTGVWPGADWHERETYDMFGIAFDGHPDLTRIMMPDDWQGHPLRKDFPVGGTRSFYFKRDTQPHAGEPPGLIPRIRVQDSDI